jgi:hypothetical protein
MKQNTKTAFSIALLRKDSLEFCKQKRQTPRVQSPRAERLDIYAESETIQRR